ncbi:predicted protein [Histoplasma capsulatum G186AR]|uniref:Uncharacterized protein n=1 Tax=Ajellomyces capsulatus (strain G186AR / H82 / ATCC MYA-2454 / RMSCC 2432) TaxID=447093 RepID=C0NWR0_AJECG|nr:uncharacterized protein HCBG_07590 [Histoplasma capsulatum G186AR]EEH04365.1 predicted protein [Histoplasma capsulatum G186AR]
MTRKRLFLQRRHGALCLSEEAPLGFGAEQTNSLLLIDYSDTAWLEQSVEVQQNVDVQLPTWVEPWKNGCGRTRAHARSNQPWSCYSIEAEIETKSTTAGPYSSWLKIDTQGDENILQSVTPLHGQSVVDTIDSLALNYTYILSAIFISVNDVNMNKHESHSRQRFAYAGVFLD